MSNDAETKALRRNAAVDAWDLRDEAVLVASGVSIPVAGTDQYHEFHAHPEFRYLSGLGIRGGVLSFDTADGWRLFVPVPGEDDRVWVGDGVPLEQLAAQSGFDRVQPLEDLRAWLERHRGTSVAILGNRDILERPEAYALDGFGALEGDVDLPLSQQLSERIAEARRAKDTEELASMRAAAAASLPGHLALLRWARPGMTERELQIEMEADFFRRGAERTAYGSLVGAGPNSAVLHASPSSRPLKDGDLVLVDAAAEWDGYAADISRTFPAGSAFSAVQRDLYEMLLGVQERAIARVRPGVEFKDLHLQASAEIAAGLVDMRILRGSPQQLVERDVHAMFFPHGLGHMLGLSTHDAGGCLAGRESSERFGLKWLRADLPLQEDYVVTIEPGIYFIPALLDDRRRRRAFVDVVDWDRIDALMPFGGMRIEDDVRVTADGSEVLSAGLPKDVASIEELRCEALAE